MRSVLQDCKKGAGAAGGHHKGCDKDSTAREGLLAPLESIGFARLNSTPDSQEIFLQLLVESGGFRKTNFMSNTSSGCLSKDGELKALSVLLRACCTQEWKE